MKIVTTHIGNHNKMETLYPGKADRTIPSWAFALPEKYLKLLREVSIALDRECSTLATMGIRALLDLFMTEVIGDQGTFKQRIKRLEEDGYISTEQRHLIKTILEAGHAASHRGYTPEMDTLTKILDMIEHLLQVKVLSASSQVILKAIPTRESNGFLRRRNN